MADRSNSFQQSVPAGSPLRGLAPSLLLNGVAPFAAYQVLTGHGVPGFDALLTTSVFPLLGLGWSWTRSRHLDGIGVISLIFIALGLVTSLISGDQRFYLIKESFLTALFGLVCLGSLLLPRPLMFYFGRQFASGGDPAGVARYNSLWQYVGFRRVQRLITAVWGLGYIAEALARLALTFVLPIPIFLIVSPLLAFGVTIALITWTMAYARRSAKRGDELRARLAAGQTP